METKGMNTPKETTKNWTTDLWVWNIDTIEIKALYTEECLVIDISPSKGGEIAVPHLRRTNQLTSRVEMAQPPSFSLSIYHLKSYQPGQKWLVLCLFWGREDWPEAFWHPMIPGLTRKALANFTSSLGYLGWKKGFEYPKLVQSTKRLR